jgi:hypothetical protein
MSSFLCRVSQRRPGETGYKIPHGGLFRLVTGANFLGEIIEWGGWALAQCSLPGMSAHTPISALCATFVGMDGTT